MKKIHSSNGRLWLAGLAEGHRVSLWILSSNKNGGGIVKGTHCRFPAARLPNKARQQSKRVLSFTGTRKKRREEGEEEGHLQLETLDRVQTNEVKSKRRRASPT